MKKSFVAVLSVVLLASATQVSAKPLIGTIGKYIINENNRIIEIGSTEIEDDGLTATYYDYVARKRLSINMSEVSKSTRESINNVSAGEMILVTTGTARNNGETVNRYCQVFHLFENKKAYVGCKTYDIDNINGYARPNRLDFIINNVENVVAEVSKVDELEKGGIATLRVDTKNAKAGRNVRILALFTNGEALVQKLGLGVLDTNSIVYKSNIDRVNIGDLVLIEKKIEGPKDSKD
jgi:hypothetical protein